MSAKKSELPIFFDVTGRRWRRLKLWLVSIFVVLLGVALWEGYRVSSLEDFQHIPGANVDAGSLASEISHTNVPVIGEGPLVRVVQVTGSTIKDLYRDTPTRQLSPADQATVGQYGYAIERYGGTTAGGRLVLTFDDGPDPIYTRQLLDVLSEERVPATFFIVGSSTIQHPDIVKRIVREGHGIANHSFTHADFESVPALVAEQEINLTRRAIRAISGYDTTFVRPPYAGVGDQLLRNSLHGILLSQSLGQTVALYDYDTKDWQHRPGDPIPNVPVFDGRDKVMLLHDGGGDRAETIAYVKSLIKQARRHGYSFATMHSLYPGEPSYFQPAFSPPEDHVTVAAYEVITVWPLRITWGLFILTTLFILSGLLVYSILAIVENRRMKRYATLEISDFCPAVAVIVPAYNEEKVLKSCVVGLLKSTYPNLRVCIVDDGSTDKTWRIARRLAAKYDNVKAYHQDNAGKSAAINRAIKHTWSPIIISIDADTVFLPDTVNRLVRHFKNPYVGAVAGMVRIGNISNILTRCQALEYSTSISLERTAQAHLSAITVVPGACGAWRREAIVKAGRYSSETLAEDCDLTIGVHAAGYGVIQDNTAISYTEAPMNLRSFVRQRFRWAFGNLQVYWKYRRLILGRKRDWLNSLVLPLAIISIIGPVLFLPLLGIITLQNIFSGEYDVLLLFSAITVSFLLIRAFIALRIGGDRLVYLWVVPVVWILYGPLHIYLIYGTLLKAIQGGSVGWNKFARVGGVALRQASPQKTKFRLRRAGV